MWRSGTGEQTPMVAELRDGSRCEVFSLAQKPHLVELCAQLCFTEFEDAYRDLGVESAAAAAENLYAFYLNRETAPLVLVALAEGSGEFLGTVTLDEQDMSTRPQLTPWVADLLVVQAVRGRGVASVLMRALVSVCKTIGVRTLYLWTETKEAFFAKRGFQRLEPERLEYAGVTVTLMHHALVERVSSLPFSPRSADTRHAAVSAEPGVAAPVCGGQMFLKRCRRRERKQSA